VNVRFVDIGGIVDHHCLNFILFCWFVDIGGIVDHHYLNFIFNYIDNKSPDQSPIHIFDKTKYNPLDTMATYYPSETF